MKITFRSEDFAELNFERQFSEGFAVSDHSGISETKSEFEYKGFHSKTHRISCPGLIYSMIEGSLEQDLIQILESDFPYLQMHFEFSTTGCLYYPDARFDIPTIIYGGSHSLLFYPALKGKLHYLKKPDSFSVEIELTLDFFRRLFNNDLEVLKTFGENIERNLPAIMGNRSYPISSQMRQILMDIKNYPFTGSLKKLFVEAKVIELLTLQIAQINEEENGKSNLKRVDIHKLYEVKDLLIKNLNNPYSIEELSRIAGINRTKLQDGFKELFGTTVFGYLADSRLEEARKLILAGNHATISEISGMIGYKNPQHFTAAFKRKYGYLPKDIK